MREDTIDEMGGAIGVFLGACFVFCFFQRTIDETVFCIHDGCLRVVACLFLHACRSLVAGLRQFVEVLQALLSCHVMSQIVEHLTVMLQQFQCQKAGRVVLGDMFVGLQVFLNMTDTVFYLMTIIDVQVTRELTCSLIYLNDCFEKILDTSPILKRCGNHRCTHEATQCLDVHTIATPLELIIHIQGTHHADVHIHKLSCQIQVTL